MFDGDRYPSSEINSIKSPTVASFRWYYMVSTNARVDDTLQNRTSYPPTAATSGGHYLRGLKFQLRNYTHANYH